MSNIEKANNLAMGVVGDAALILETIDQPIEFPEQIFNWLKETYGTKRTVEELMGSVKQLKEESVRSYFGRVKARLLTIYENGKSVAYESALVLYFRAGLLQPIQKALYALHPSGVVATLQSATQIESDFNQARLLKNNASDPMYLMETETELSTIESTNSANYNLKRTNLKSTHSSNKPSTTKQHDASKYNYNSSQNSSDSKKRTVRIVCYFCQQRGHSFRNCFKANDAQKAAIEKNLSTIKIKHKNFQNDLNSLLVSAPSTTGTQ